MAVVSYKEPITPLTRVLEQAAAALTPGLMCEVFEQIPITEIDQQRSARSEEARSIGGRATEDGDGIGPSTLGMKHIGRYLEITKIDSVDDSTPFEGLGNRVRPRRGLWRRCGENKVEGLSQHRIELKACTQAVKGGTPLRREIEERGQSAPNEGQDGSIGQPSGCLNVTAGGPRTLERIQSAVDRERTFKRLGRDIKGADLVTARRSLEVQGSRISTTPCQVVRHIEELGSSEQRPPKAVTKVRRHEGEQTRAPTSSCVWRGRGAHLGRPIKRPHLPPL